MSEADSSSKQVEQPEPLLIPRHVKYLKRVLGILPSETQSLDTSRWQPPIAYTMVVCTVGLSV